jgi:hypothetical protein
MSVASKGFTLPIYNSLRSAGTGSTASATTTIITIPNDSNGSIARGVLLSAAGVANAAVHVRFGNVASSSSTQSTATLFDFMVTGTPIGVNCRGSDTIFMIAEVAGSKLMVSPIEGF